MWIYYDSKTGNVERFMEKLRVLRDWNLQKIGPDLQVNHPGHLVTFTTRIGEIPESTVQFLSTHAGNIMTVSSSGNRNWGQNFARAADLVSLKYQIPVSLKFELSGTKKDVNNFIEILEQIHDC
ncbi:class Ib ribonucleoside-diphosphate reductase assembly flavoprotein NrdI [Arcticibacter eurypsychrophilus]|uniref:class Ib ribonucleoside-diphosphate reductase assembly flavoprotein NrdI n=1 Tax=Arcticibacter eurypsychrophilus TaxID=1434752 RepID=UPI00084D3619|nr:class Ib ribonucleoside-diphosphate reductase assembly flavoprotein NrdI [Arcticibacter eurypsychrophilus]